MHAFLVSVVAFIVLIGVMIVVHEFGHFLVAKLCGVRVEQFSIGFPPRLFGFKIGETDYCVSALPLGGYVKMTGENMPGENMSLEGAEKEQIEAQKSDPGALTSHPRWQRMLIAVAGPTANFVLAFVLMFIYFGWINQVPAVQVKQPTIEWVTNGSAAAQAGFQPGDIIRRFDTVSNPTWERIYERAKLNPNQTVQVTVERDGKLVPLSFHVPASAKDDDFDLSDAGILPQYLTGPIIIHKVEPGTPAQWAGLKAGDEIKSVDGHPFHYVGTLAAYLQDDKGKPVTLSVIRNGVTLPPIVVRPAQVSTRWQLGIETKAIPMRNEPLPLNQALAKSTIYCKQKSLLIVDVLDRLIRHKVAVSQLAGPVGIARVAGEAAETKGWSVKIGLAAIISLNLGVLNLLPIPILDGGGILMLMIESMLRHDIKPNIKDRIYQTAFVLLIAFFAFVTYNDIAKLPIFRHLHH